MYALVFGIVTRLDEDLLSFRGGRHFPLHGPKAHSTLELAGVNVLGRHY